MSKLEQSVAIVRHPDFPDPNPFAEIEFPTKILSEIVEKGAVEDLFNANLQFKKALHALAHPVKGLGFQEDRLSLVNSAATIINRLSAQEVLEAARTYLDSRGSGRLDNEMKLIELLNRVDHASAQLKLKNLALIKAALEYINSQIIISGKFPNDNIDPKDKHGRQKANSIKPEKDIPEFSPVSDTTYAHLRRESLTYSSGSTALTAATRSVTELEKILLKNSDLEKNPFDTLQLDPIFLRELQDIDNDDAFIKALKIYREFELVSTHPDITSSALEEFFTQANSSFAQIFAVEAKTVRFLLKAYLQRYSTQVKAIDPLLLEQLNDKFKVLDNLLNENATLTTHANMFVQRMEASIIKLFSKQNSRAFNLLSSSYYLIDLNANLSASASPNLQILTIGASGEVNRVILPPATIELIATRSPLALLAEDLEHRLGVETIGRVIGEVGIHKLLAANIEISSEMVKSLALNFSQAIPLAANAGDIESLRDASGTISDGQRTGRYLVCYINQQVDSPLISLLNIGLPHYRPVARLQELDLNQDLEFITKVWDREFGPIGDTPQKYCRFGVAVTRETNGDIIITIKDLNLENLNLSESVRENSPINLDLQSDLRKYLRFAYDIRLELDRLRSFMSTALGSQRELKSGNVSISRNKPENISSPGAVIVKGIEGHPAPINVTKLALNQDARKGMTLAQAIMLAKQVKQHFNASPYYKEAQRPD